MRTVRKPFRVSRYFIGIGADQPWDAKWSDGPHWEYHSGCNLWIDTVQQDKLLHNGEACFYTDPRFESTTYQELLWWRRPKSLKTAFRKLQRSKGLSVGVKVNITNKYYSSRGSYTRTWTCKKATKLPTFQIGGGFLNQATSNDWFNELVSLLRRSGFLVAVHNNVDFLIGEHPGQIAVAYGFGKRVGFSSEGTFRGYGQGVESILWDWREEFDKWSRCNKILKTSSFEDILKTLINDHTF